MNGGRIEQIAPPEEIYRRPATAFVADFLGSMNLVPASSSQDGAAGAPGVRWVGSASTSLPPDVQVGFRSEACRTGTADGHDGLQIRGVVRLVEVLGADVLLHLDAGTTPIRATAPIGTARVGDTYTGCVPLHDVHVVDDGRLRVDTW